MRVTPAAAAVLAVLACACLLAGCRGPSDRDGITISQTVPSGTPAPEGPDPTPGDDRLQVVALRELAPEAAALVDGAGLPVGVAVAIPARATVYVGGGSHAFALASTVKVPLLLAELARARSEGHVLTPEEREQLRAMITLSDNEPASDLFTRLGEGPGVRRLLAPLGGDRFRWPPDDAWGDTAASARDLAELLAHLLTGAGIDPADREFVLALMRDVADFQRWGASAGLNLTDEAGVALAIKNGWYPETTGWRIVSAAIVDARGLEYVIVLMTEDQPEHSDGVWLLEQIAGAVHHALLPPALVADVVRSLPPPPAGESPDDEADGDPPPAAGSMALIALAGSDVLVPADARLVSVERAPDSLSYVFEVESADAQAVLAEYQSAMVERGWTADNTGAVLLLTSEDRAQFVVADASTSAASRVLLHIAFSTG